MSQWFKNMEMTRRELIANMLGVGMLGGLSWYGYQRLRLIPPEVNIYRPGLEFGHMMREHQNLPEPVATWHCNVLIAGSGASALAAAWKLKREGMHDFVMLEGPEPDGNNAGIVNKELRYPTAAHYFALPSQESSHIREMLSDIGVLIGDPYAQAPEYDEMVLVHALEERLLRGDVWQEGLLPQEDADSRRFFQQVREFSQAIGGDGKPVFTIPIALASHDAQWLELDKVTFSNWLEQEGYTSASLLWYLNYCCRDDYGQGIQHVSAWAGLHYFAARTGEAKSAGHGAVLTWPDGLASFNRKLREFIGFERHDSRQPADRQNLQTPAVMAGSVLKMTEYDDRVELLVGVTGQGKELFQTVKVIANQVICAMPLYMATYVVDDIKGYGFDPKEHMPTYGPWMISNFVFDTYPQEKEGAPLAWDNVVLEGAGLGYVVSTHQLIRAAKPERTAFTAYYALDEEDPKVVRQWMMSASQDELVAKAVSDLQEAYPKDLWRYLRQIDITLRGHAMASPTPGYRSNAGLKALQEHHGRILFAHSDLSGYSVVEEAAWWGVEAARKILG
ncbi:MAG: NAD(P)-binding protein [Saezia sp.]